MSNVARRTIRIAVGAFMLSATIAVLAISIAAMASDASRYYGNIYYVTPLLLGGGLALFLLVSMLMAGPRRRHHAPD